MNITATDAPRGIDEVALAGLTTIPSLQVQPPRIAGTPMSMECRLHQFIEPGGSSTVMLGRVVGMHVRRDCFADEAHLYLDPAAMQLIGRMHGAGGYCTTSETFEIPRIAWKDLPTKT